MSKSDLFDVVAVNIATGAERFLDQKRDRKNAEAIVSMAVMRRGVNEEFYKVEPHPHRLRASRAKVLSEAEADKKTSEGEHNG